MPPRAKDPRRYCRFCSARLRRKAFASGRLEDMGVFKRRKYCDRLCMAKGMQQPDVSRQSYYQRARKHRKPACERCGTADRLHVHHKDGNFKNNDPANLETLCETCHGKEHGPKRGNTFAGRQWLLKTDLAEIWALLRTCAIDAPASRKRRIENILHKHGQL